MAVSHLVCLFCVSAGQNGESLGTDEEQIIEIDCLVFDIARNKVSSWWDVSKLSPTYMHSYNTRFLPYPGKYQGGLRL